MKILLAIDGSASSDHAREFVTNVAWPPGSLIHVLAVVPPAVGAGLGWPEAVPAPDVVERLFVDAQAEAERVTRAAADAIAIRGPRTEPSVRLGRPASVIVEQARDLDVDLVVVGSRGRGRLTATVLGSVSTEVAESCGRPVLVIRTSSVGSLVFGEDGSADAAVARQLVATMPGFRGIPVRVVSVSELSPSWYGWLEPAAAGDTQAYEEAIVADRGRYTALARRSAMVLEAAGLRAESETRSGEAGREIVAAATDFGGDLIVIGRHGQSAINRLLLGSVARKILGTAHCSVLIIPAIGASTEVPELSR